MGSPKLSSKESRITPFHDQVVAWRRAGEGFRRIAAKLREQQVDVDHNAVARYCSKLGIPASDEIPQDPIDVPVPRQAEDAFSAASPPPEVPIAIPVPTHVSPPASSAPAPIPALVISTAPAQHVVTAPKPPILTFGTQIPLTVPASDLRKAPETPRSSVRTPPVLQEPYSPPPWRPPPLNFTPLQGTSLWRLDLELLTFPRGGGIEDVWSLRDACEGALIVGGTGSGKTSGSGRSLAMAFLESGFGGIVLTVKPEERRLWEHYARCAGRSQQLCIVEPGGKHRLNFVDYELRRPGSSIENVVNLFYAVMEVYTRRQGSAEAYGYWLNAGRQLLRNAFRILEHVRQPLQLRNITRLVTSAPMRHEEAEDQVWRARAPFGEWMQGALQAAKGTPGERVVEEAAAFWLREFPNLADKTRSVIISGFTTMADGFIDSPIYELFCTDTTLIPEAVLQGAIIIVDLPIKRFDAVGLFAQSIWKYLFQKAVERRSDPDDASRRPVFLWVDEAQFFYSDYDGLFQSTARSSRCATVYLTQNLPTFYGLMNHPQARQRVDGFMGNLNTKIFHANNCPVTNQWAAEHIGRSWKPQLSSTLSHPSRDILGLRSPFATPSGSTTVSQSLQFELEPGVFTRLRTGGEGNNLTVDAYLLKSGTTFRSSGKQYILISFQQEPRA